MERRKQKLLSLLLAGMLWACCLSGALAQESTASYIVLGTQYAYHPSGQVALYNGDGAPIGAVANGARLTVTDGERDGRTYVRFGAVAAWVDTGDLTPQLPNEEEAPNSLTPIRTEPPAGEAAPDDASLPEAAQTGAAAPEADNPAAGEAAPDDASLPEGDAGENPPLQEENTHEPISALYDTGLGEAIPVEVIRLEPVTSLIVTGEELQQVETAALTFGEEVPPEKKLGYVYAPRTGQAGLRQEPSGEGKVLTQLKAGQLVAVLAIGEEYAHISVQGQEGWLRLDCLRYLDQAVEGMARPAAQAQPSDEANTSDGAEVLIAVEGTAPATGYPRTGVLTLQGSTDGEDTVNLRCLPSRDSSKVTSLPTGTEITLLAGEDGWCFVFANGYCAYVMESFVAPGE